MIIKQDTCTRMKLLYLHIVIKSLTLVLKTETSGNPKMYPTGLELALENGETCLSIYCNVENIRLLIYFFYSSSHDCYDSKETGNAQKNVCATEPKLYLE